MTVTRVPCNNSGGSIQVFFALKSSLLLTVKTNYFGTVTQNWKLTLCCCSWWRWGKMHHPARHEPLTWPLPRTRWALNLLVLCLALMCCHLCNLHSGQRGYTFMYLYLSKERGAEVYVCHRGNLHSGQRGEHIHVFVSLEGKGCRGLCLSSG